MSEHWSVQVCIGGESILTIESNCLCGKADLTDEEQERIRLCAEHLLAFVGPRKAEVLIADEDAINW